MQVCPRECEDLNSHINVHDLYKANTVSDSLDKQESAFMYELRAIEEVEKLRVRHEQVGRAHGDEVKGATGEPWEVDGLAEEVFSFCGVHDRLHGRYMRAYQ